MRKRNKQNKISKYIHSYAQQSQKKTDNAKRNKNTFTTPKKSR